MLSVDIQVMPYAYTRAAAVGAPYSPADSISVVVGDPWPGGARAQVGHKRLARDVPAYTRPLNFAHVAQVCLIEIIGPSAVQGVPHQARLPAAAFPYLTPPTLARTCHLRPPPQLRFPYTPGCEELVAGESAELMVLCRDDVFHDFKVGAVLAVVVCCGRQPHSSLLRMLVRPLEPTWGPVADFMQLLHGTTWVTLAALFCGCDSVHCTGTHMAHLCMCLHMRTCAHADMHAAAAGYM